MRRSEIGLKKGKAGDIRPALSSSSRVISLIYLSRKNLLKLLRHPCGGLCNSCENRAKLKVLFVCSSNLDRSPTAESLFHNWNEIWQARSAGINSALGRRRLTQAQVDWADLILVMEPIHSEYVQTHFKCANKEIEVLNISNRFVNGDPKLINELKTKIIPLLEAYAKRKG